jgi:hypothetical protein
LQDYFLQEVYKELKEHMHKIPELESIADPDKEVVNAFLREKGFDIQLDAKDPPTDPLGIYGFAVASIFDLLLKWIRPGTKDSVLCNNKTYEAARMGKRAVNFLEGHNHPHPIARIQAENGDLVYMTVLNDSLKDLLNNQQIMQNTFYVLDYIKNIMNNTLRNYDDFSGLIFPTVSINDYPDISWIESLNEKDTPLLYYVEQALQQTKFKMDEIGAHVKSASAMYMAGSGCCLDAVKPNYVIDKPFILWITRDGISQPIFIGHFSEDSWKANE